MRRLKSPLLMIAMSITALGAIAQTSANPKTTSYGPSEVLSGVYFSNFESAQFIVCGTNDPLCNDETKAEYYSLACDKDSCAALWEKARSTPKPPDQTIKLSVVLVGRRSVGKATPQFLGDLGQSIQVEKIKTIETSRVQ